MQKRTRTALLVAAGLLVGLACDDGVEMVGDAMVDAGEVLRDAGDEMVPDAAAQAPVDMTVACNQEVVVSRSTGPSGELSEQIAYYAEVQIPGVTPETVQSVTAVQCDREDFAPPTPPTCPMGWTCEREPNPALRCFAGGAHVADGVVRAVCGNTVRTRDTAGVETVSGQRWRTVRFVVEE